MISNGWGCMVLSITSVLFFITQRYCIRYTIRGVMGKNLAILLRSAEESWEVESLLIGAKFGVLLLLSEAVLLGRIYISPDL